MSRDDLILIKKRAYTIEKVLKFIFKIAIILFFTGVIVVLAIIFFASPERFNAVRGNLNWHITYNFINDSSFFIDIPFKFIQLLDSSKFNAKHAVSISLISILLKESLILYGLNQVVKILYSISNDIPPFTMDNVERLKKLSYSIVIYSVAADILSNVLYSIFVTKIFVLDLSNIHLGGVLIGGLILVIADIFKYGVYLQNEFDTQV
jgi:hypothetical protein